MIRIAPFAATALALSVPAMAAARPAAPAMAADPDRKALGFELAKLLNGEDAVMATLTRVFTTTLPEAMQRDANVRTMEEQHPGAVKAMIDVMVPIMIRYMRGEMPALWNRIGDLYAENLSEADLRAALAFYGGPTGTRIIALMYDGMDFTKVFNNMVDDGDYKVKASDFGITSGSGARATMAKLTPQETQATVRFGMSPEGRRLTALTPRMTAMMTEWANAPHAGLETELQTAVQAVVGRMLTEDAAK